MSLSRRYTPSHGATRPKWRGHHANLTEAAPTQQTRSRTAQSAEIQVECSAPGILTLRGAQSAIRNPPKA
eukprot:664183-Alexandrium_andersonii.AAC.1